ncbi:uncharacterized protein LOC144055734 [Vanacampus margaritifer]
MGEVTLVVDELVRKVLLPEPQLIILALPPPFLPTPDEPDIVWPKWLNSFERYLDALDDKNLTDANKCMLLHNCLGQEGQRVFTALVPPEHPYAAAVSTLTAYFTAGRTTRTRLLRFHQRAQLAGESTDEYVAALKALMAPGDSPDELILNQLIEKTKWPQLKEQLRSQRQTLTLATALNIAKEAESGVVNEPDVKPLAQRRKRGRPRRADQVAIEAQRPQRQIDCCHNDAEKVAIETQRPQRQIKFSCDENKHKDDTEDNGENHDEDSDDKNSDGSWSPPWKSEKFLGEPTVDGNTKTCKAFTCVICMDRHFTGANKLARHMRTHTQEKPFHCPVCRTVFSQSYHLTRHMREQHNAARYVCPVCCDSFRSVADLKSHKRTHAAQGPERSPDDDEVLRHLAYHQECEQGSAEAVRGQDVITSMEEIQTNMLELFTDNVGSVTDGGSSETKESDFRVKTETTASCAGDELILNQLMEKTKWRQTLATALSVAKEAESGVVNGPDVKPLVQRRKRGRPRRADKVAIETQRPQLQINCSRHENQQKDYEVDQDGGNDDEDSDDKNDESWKLEELLGEPTTDGNIMSRKTFTCDICTDKHFTGAHKLARHMRSHTREKPFRCPDCPTVFSESYHLTRHMRVQHHGGRYVCLACCQSFQSLAELKSHKKTHTAHFRLCPYCPERSPDDDAFLRHLASHQEHQRGGAEVLQGQDAIGNMEQIQTNMAESLMETKESDSRLETETSHEGISGASVPCKKSHVCPVCNVTFTYATRLSRHMRSHTKEKPFRCTVCAITFSQSYHRNRHMRRQHGVRQYGCHKCGKTFASWLQLKEHRKAHSGKELACPACKKSFKEKAHLELHLKSHNSIPHNPHSLICEECGKVFRRRYHLKRHIMMHYRVAKNECYTCAECHKNFPEAENLKRHLLNHAKEKSGTCARCDRSFGSPEELKAHLEAHAAAYLCSVCGRRFKVEAVLRKHEEKHKGQHYHCAVCSRHFGEPAQYKRHVEMHDRRESKCPHCDGVFLKHSTFKYHLQTHTKERPHQCTYCMDTFVHDEDLERHRLKHRKFRKERPYKCTRCEAAFAALAELTAHMEGHKGQAPLSCDICGRTFLNAGKLEKHQSIHTGVRPHLCPHCGNGFVTAANLKQHIYSHTGEKPFACKECSKTFRSASGLRLHGRRHMEAPPSFECADCGRTYGRMTELRMHQRYHTGDRPYSCVSCNKTFISKHKLMVHARIHTGERPYSCPHCMQTFRQTGDRNRHINKFHPKDAELVSTTDW